MTPRFGYIPIASPLLSAEAREQLLSSYSPGLEALGGERWSTDDVTRDAPVILLVLTGGTERALHNAWGRRRLDHGVAEPAILVAHRGSNSLPAALETLARLRQDGGNGTICFLDGPDDARGLECVEQAVLGVEVRRELRNTRIGLIGAPSEWLIASAPDHAVVRRRWGPQVVPVELDELKAAIEEVSADDAAAPSLSLTGGANEVCEPTVGELADAARVYLALKALIERHELQAVAVRCFDLVVDLDTTGCFALSQLLDDGIVAGCEGDLVSTVGMLWARLLTGEVPWMANPARLDVEENSLWLAHCTVPRGMVDGYRVRSHFESGLGVALAGTMAAGPITVFRIGGKEMEQLWLAEGEITRAGDAEDMCRTQVEVKLGRPGAAGELLREPLGNHLGLVRGSWGERMRGGWDASV